MNTTNWTTAAGLAIAITVATGYGLNRQGVRKTKGYREVIIEATIDGKKQSTIGGLQTITGHATCVAKIGNIGLTADRLAPIADAIAAAQSEIAAHNAEIDARAAGLDNLGNGNINAMFGADA